MEKLVQAAMDFLAAVLGALGFIGRPRRRAGIVADLDLLDRLCDSNALGAGSRAHEFLVRHIELEVAKLAKAELTSKKRIPWSAVAVALIIGAPLAFLTYKLDQSGFRWYSVFPGAVAALMFLSGLGMVFDRAETPSDVAVEKTDEPSPEAVTTQAAFAADPD